ncbi:MAG: J domain-containing protein [Syntrophobacteraceae bacterium]|nr:J domain-containing protein [Syntrophobacteraceae bacterium]
MKSQPSNTREEDFRLLGIEPGTSPARVKQAYRELAKKWHPDFFHQKGPRERRIAEERFKEITAAYRRLSRAWKNPSERATEPVKGKSKASSRPRNKSQAAATDRTARDGWASGLAGLVMAPFRHALTSKHSRVIRVGVGVLFLGCSLVWMLSHWRPVEKDFFRPFITGRPSAQLPSVEPSPLPPSRNPHLPATDTPNAVSGAAPETASPASESPPRGHTSGPSPYSPPPFFTLGSTEKEVLQVQGPPSRIHGQTWTYNLSEVHFKDGQVWRYNNFDGSLKVQLTPSTSPQGDPPSFFSLGSSKDEVLLVQGTPTRIQGNRWYYGFSEIRFKDNRVQGYDNYFGNLKVRLFPSDPLVGEAHPDFFTMGATPDEVLVVQGTPTSIQGNTWFYDLSSILFRESKVQYVSNISSNLRYVAPPETP